MHDRIFRRDAAILNSARRRLAQVDASRGFLPEPPPAATEALVLAEPCRHPTGRPASGLDLSPSPECST